MKNQWTRKGLYGQVLPLFKRILSSRKVLSHDYQDEMNSCKSLYLVEVLERLNEVALIPDVWPGLCMLHFHLVYQPPLTLVHVFEIVPDSVVQV